MGSQVSAGRASGMTGPEEYWQPGWYKIFAVPKQQKEEFRTTPRQLQVRINTSANMLGWHLRGSSYLGRIQLVERVRFLSVKFPKDVPAILGIMSIAEDWLMQIKFADTDTTIIRDIYVDGLVQPRRK